MPGAFLAFSLLPGIRRARYRESQVSGEPGIADCNAVAVRSSGQSDIYLGRRGCARTLIH